MQTPYFPDWSRVYSYEHLPGILCTSRNKCSGYIVAVVYFKMTHFSEWIALNCMRKRLR